MGDSAPVQKRSSRAGGAFGFSPLETRGLLALAATVAVIAGVQSWADRAQPVAPPATVVELTTAPSGESRLGNDSPIDVSATAEIEYDHRTDVNNANRYQLMRLPGIGEVLADRIIASREKDGPFRSLRDLQRVFGIGPKKAAMLGGWVRFGEIGPEAVAGEADE